MTATLADRGAFGAELSEVNLRRTVTLSLVCYLPVVCHQPQALGYINEEQRRAKEHLYSVSLYALPRGYHIFDLFFAACTPR